MIPAKGWDARFKETLPDGKVRWITQPVIAWMPPGELFAGDGLVMNENETGLVWAQTRLGFGGFERSDEEVEAVVPAAPGWWVEWDNDGEGVPFREPVIAFLIGGEGFGLKVIGPPDALGWAEPSDIDKNARLIFMPDEGGYWENRSRAKKKEDKGEAA